MISNNCGKGLAVFSLTFLLGIFLNNLLEENCILRKAEKVEEVKVVSVKGRNLSERLEKQCVKEFEKVDSKPREEKIQAETLRQTTEIEERLPENVFPKKKKRENGKALKESLTQTEKFEKLPLTPQTKSNFKKLFYTENCYDF